MNSEFAKSRVFIRGAARYHDLLYVLSKGKKLLEQDISHTSAICVDQGDWADAEDTAWDSTAIAVAKTPTERLVFVGEDGDVCTYVGGKSTSEKIEPAPKLIRNAKTIDGFVVVCGMLRQVFQRIDEGKWKDISAPLPKAGEKVGFEAIDGYSLKELYTVGWAGEIWQFDGFRWVDRNSPTNLILSSICCAQDDVVYLGGQRGILIQGRNDSWEITKWEEEVDVDIWDLCWFKGRLYVATMTALFILDKNKLVEVDFGALVVSSCYSLTKSEGVLWSVGNSDVLSFDGNKWVRYG